MDSRQRVALALSHQQPDRVPVDYWAQPEVTDRLMRRLGCATKEELLTRLDVDFRYIDGPRYIGPPPTVRPDGSVEDHFGVPRVKVRVGQGESAGSYSEVVDFPLAGKSLAQIKDYPHWPSPDWFDYTPVRQQAADARAASGSEKVVVFMGDRTNRCAQLKPAMYLRGVEQILLDMALAPEIAEYLFGRIAEFYLEYARRTFEAVESLDSRSAFCATGGLPASAARNTGGQAASGTQITGTPGRRDALPKSGIDIFLTGDDFGTQNGLLVSPTMWRTFLRPGFEAFVRLGKKYGCRVAHHSCGSIRPIIGDMIDCGLDILNPVQPDVADMDRRTLKQAFGDRLTFHGSVSIQSTVPHGTREDIRREVAERFETLGPGGGLILCTAHNIQPDTPSDNVLALFEAYRELAVYG